MGTVTATAEASIPESTERVLAALADYRNVRPAILPEQYSEYAVESGGEGTGTVATWRLQATRKRVRHVVADVTVDDDSVIEQDRNSTMVTSFRVRADGDITKVTATTTWEGASGVGGFFERTFAPGGLGRIHAELLANLAASLATQRR